MTEKLLLLAAAGAVGTLARYGLILWVQDVSKSAFPWGTVVVNVLGCFLFGLVWGLADVEGRMRLTAGTRAVILTGFMGAFTTFSTYIFETEQLLKDTQWWMAAGNVAVQNVVGLVLMVLGIALGRML